MEVPISKCACPLCLGATNQHIVETINNTNNQSLIIAISLILFVVLLITIGIIVYKKKIKKSKA